MLAFLALLAPVIAIEPNLYPYDELALKLSTAERKVELGQDLVGRAALVSMKARPQEDALRVVAKALDLAVEKTEKGYRLIRDPDKLAAEHRLQQAYVEDLDRLLQERVS